jgi:transcriptional regulator with XRE-family HTH domain
MDKKDAKLIGKRIKTFRNSAGLTQEQLAKKTTISLSAIGKYEIGERTPKYETLEEIAKALHVSTGELMGHSEVKKTADERKMPEHELYIDDIGVDIIDSKFIDNYKYQIISFRGVIKTLESAENQKLIKLFHEIIMNIERLLDDMKIEGLILDNDNDKDFINNFINKFNFNKYDLLCSCLKKSKGDKEKLLENLEELQLLFFESRCDGVIADLKAMKDNYLKTGDAFKGQRK